MEIEEKKPSKQRYKIGQNWVIDRGIILGQGQLGTVYEGFNRQTKQKIAAKEYNISQIYEYLGDQTKEYLEREVQVMMKVSHQNIVQILDVKQTQPQPGYTNLYIIMEKLSGGTLQQMIAEQKQIQENQAKIIFKQILSGYQSIFNQGAIHRDLKPANILFTENQQQAKITDFGLAKFLTQNQFNQENTIYITNRGTPHYKCPELLNYNEYIQIKYPTKIDIWSLGVILYEMLYGQLPWNVENQDISLGEYCQIICNTQIQFPQNIQIEESTKQLILKMLELDPQRRYDYNDCISHPFCQ